MTTPLRKPGGETEPGLISGDPGHTSLPSYGLRVWLGISLIFVEKHSTRV